MIHETLVGDKNLPRRCSTSILMATLRRKFSRVCSRIRWFVRRRPRLTVIVRRLQRKKHSSSSSHNNNPKSSSVPYDSERPIRIATFNVAMFSLAPAVPNPNTTRATTPRRSILKQSPLHTGNSTRSNLKVSINLPDNEISLANNKLLNLMEGEAERCASPMLVTRSKVPARSPICFPYNMMGGGSSVIRNCNDELEEAEELSSSNKSILEVLREVNADILGLQDVKAEEEKGMRPLSDLARALGMHYVFAESWAPQYGNAVLSRWPIKRWRVEKIADDEDFRNVVKATVQVPWGGELNFNCTQLDHLDEYWRMRQIKAIILNSSSSSLFIDPPHILAGGLNSLDQSDYSAQRWTHILKYYEEMGKPKPKAEVMKYLNGKQYVDAKHFAADCEPVVIIAKGQNVQGTCKYGTRVDYVLASPFSPFMFVPNSYSVISSKGTSDHHIVKVDIVRVNRNNKDMARQQQQPRQKKKNKKKNKVRRISRYPGASSCLAADHHQKFENFPSLM